MLNLKQKKFVDEYLKSGNASQSAIKAGYSKRNSRSMGSKLLKKPEIKIALQNRVKDLSESNIMDIAEILSRLSDIARGKTTEPSYNPQSGDYDEVAAPIKDRIREMELLGKRYGAWIDKQEVQNDVVVNVDDDDDDE